MHSSGSSLLADVQNAWDAAVDAFITGTLGPLWSTQTQCTQTKTDQLDPATGKNVAQATKSVTYKGTGTGQALPQRVALVCGLRTATPTRAGRGRMYWPGPDTLALTPAGELNSTDAATIATGLAAAIATMNSTSAAVIYHRLIRTTTPVTAITVGTILGTQRRRTNKSANSYELAPL